MALSDDDVREILRIIDESDLDELRIDTESFRLHVLRGEAAKGAPAPPPEATPPPQAEARPPSRPPKPTSATRTIAAPMLGTFYVADGPGQKPFVEVGDPVEAETVVGIIEVMKMMNSVRAGLAGTVVEICAENAELVEEGQPLFLVDPA
jgi:acetyl-CoA carboxylase biotin carboxyl carrier protein